MSERDYYEVLSVSKDATASELKKAYRRLAMKYHPDRNQESPDAEAKFKEAKEAFEVLNDPQKRATYDQYGHAGLKQAGGFGGGGSDFGDIFGDVFGDIFGGGRSRGQRVSRGDDLQYNLKVSLEDAVSGTEVSIDIPTLVQCKACEGDGAKPGTKATQCSTCNGIGQVRMQQGFFSVQQTCPTCRGAGKTISDPCVDCRGQGRVQEKKTLSVKIPAGVDNGDRIRLGGEGEAAENGGTPGDLYVVISVNSHKIFTRDGSNLHCTMPIDIATAALGGELEVPTLKGKVTLKIPTGTQTEKMFRLRSKGIKSVHGGPIGDLLCKVKVETPISLTAEQKELLRKFSDTMSGSNGQKHSPQKHSWLDGVKSFFDEMRS